MAPVPSEMKEALNSIGPLPYSQLPTSDDELSSFLKEHFSHAEYLANSVPVPPSNHEQSNLSAAALPAANSAQSPSDTLLDPSHLPVTNLQKEHPDMTNGWGKPIKISPKDNPLQVSVYKMAAHDRHGAWFSRRSLHAGLGFNRWKRALQHEFAESLPIQDGPGSGAVRGIAADRRLERHSVEGLGTIDIWQLSSAFPGPVAPREFVCMNIATDTGTSRGSNFEGIEKAPRSFLVISKPTTHHDAPDRSGLVKGEYESVEMIRELPVEGADPEQNPVEWLMITRSDPGGGIPKFMVERGTPGSIVADVPKWLTWAIKKGEISDEELQATHDGTQESKDAPVKVERVDSAPLEHKQNGQEPTQGAHEHSTHSRAIEKVESAPARTTAPEHAAGVGGWVSSMTHAVEGAVGAYLPAYFHHDDEATSADTSSISSGSSFHSTLLRQTTTAGGGAVQYASPPSAPDSTTQLPESRNSDDVDPEALTREIETNGANSHAERELLKLAEKRRALDAKIAAARADDKQRAVDSADKTARDRARADEKLERERKKSEENYRRQLAKLDKRREKEAKKVESKKRKGEAKDALLSSRREKEEFKEKWRVAEQEVELLRRQVDALHRENVALTARMHAGDSGPDAVRKVKEELGRLSSESRGRAASKSSKLSADSASKASVEISK